jgi:hypothetical protein
MSGYATAIKNRLAADSLLLATLTGGVHDHAALGMFGASKLPALAYQGNGRMKPLAIVRGRGVTVTAGIQNRPTQFAATRQVVEVWLYDDRDASASALDTAGQRIYTLLHHRPLSGTFELEMNSWLRGMRAPEYGDARMARLEFEVRGRMP